VSGIPPRLDHDALVTAQRATLAAPKRRYSLAARVLFAGMDVIYGRKRTLSKFKVLELIARVPYQTWEQVAYVAVTHTHRHTDLARRIHERILDARGQQDNELLHLLILEERIARSGSHESCARPGVTGSMLTSKTTPSASTCNSSPIILNGRTSRSNRSFA
jgi:ubiquinol oxidase